MAYKVALALAAAQAVSAHFGLIYPEWRADTLTDDENSTYNQWDYPCAGVEYKTGNVTDWPLDGGSLKLDLHHKWAYVYVNLGLGENTTNFNISLTPEFLNVTGKGTLCLPKLPVPAGIEDGSLASIQVVTGGASGSALYNCADIRFTKDAKVLDNCTSTEGMSSKPVKDQSVSNDTNTDGANNNSTGGGSKDTGSGDKKNAAGILGVNNVALTTVVGLAAAFALGLGF